MDDVTRRHNLWVHTIEGGLYLGSAAFLSGQTVIPAVVRRLGGGPMLIGALPLAMYLAFFLPQILSAVHVRRIALVKPWAVGGGALQRSFILAMAVAIAVFGRDPGALALIVFFGLLTLNQMISGLTSPVWYDLVARTTEVTDRGRLAGWRTSIGSVLAFLGSFLLTAILGWLVFPYNYSLAFGLAFLLQISSILIQRRLVEASHPVTDEERESPHGWSDIIGVLRSDRHFVRFLVASGVSTAGFVSAGFFMVDAIERFHLRAASVGIFTTIQLSSQILAGFALGYLSDKKGTTRTLMVSALAMAAASVIALAATRPEHFIGAFLGIGVVTGVELMARYNFAVETAPPRMRSLYIGIMNAAIAPWYLLSVLAGGVIAAFGYRSVYAIAALCSLAGLLLLRRVRDPRALHLAVSSD